MNTAILSKCFGKTRHTSWMQAQDVCNAQVRRRDTGPMAVYHCKYCDGFHVGSTIKRVARLDCCADWSDEWRVTG